MFPNFTYKFVLSDAFYYVRQIARIIAIGNESIHQELNVPYSIFRCFEFDVIKRYLTLYFINLTFMYLKMYPLEL